MSINRGMDKEDVVQYTVEYYSAMKSLRPFETEAVSLMISESPSRLVFPFLEE